VLLYITQNVQSKAEDTQPNVGEIAYRVGSQLLSENFLLFLFIQGV